MAVLARGHQRRLVEFVGEVYVHVFMRKQHSKRVFLASLGGAEDSCLLRVVPEKDTVGGYPSGLQRQRRTSKRKQAAPEARKKCARKELEKRKKTRNSRPAPPLVYM